MGMCRRPLIVLVATFVCFVLIAACQDDGPDSEILPTITPTNTPVSIPTPTPASTLVPPPTSVLDPTPEPTPRPEPTPEPTAVPTDEFTTEPVDEGATEPVDEGVTEPVDESATEPVDEGATEPADESATEPVDEGATEPADEGATEPVDEGATEPADEGAPDPSDQATTNPLDETTTDPQDEAVAEPTPTVTPEEAIEALPWVRDGVTQYEISVVQDLERMTRPDGLGEETFWEVIRHPDMNRIDPDTGQLPGAVRHVARLVAEIHYFADWGALPRLMDMPFLESLDRLDTIPLSLLDQLLTAADTNREEACEVLSHPSWQDGLTDEERLLPLLLYLEGRDPELAAQVAALPWIEDGIDDSEYSAAYRLQDVALGSVPLLRALLAKPWVADGLDASEKEVFHEFEGLARHQWWVGDPRAPTNLEDLALQIVQMPFLETVEPGDALFLSLLTRDDIDIDWFLTNKELIGEITDERRSRIAAVFILPRDESNDVASKAKHLVNILLDPNQTVVQERMITLPLAGDVHLIAVRTDSYPHYLRSLERSIRHHEQFMEVPFPYEQSLVVVADIGGGGRYVRHGAMIIDVEYRQVSQEAVQWPLDYVAAQTYWSYHYPRWVNVGAPVFLQGNSPFMYRNERNFRIGEESCLGAYNLIDLVKGEFPPGTPCFYSMSSGIFYDLYQGMGRQAFKQGFRALYLHRVDGEYGPVRLSTDTLSKTIGRIIEEEAWYDGVKYEYCGLLTSHAWMVCQMKAAFVAGFEPQIADKADAILKLWFTAKGPG